MGNLFTNPETKEYLWCSNASRTCAECIANNLDFPNANTILYQLLRLSMAYNVSLSFSFIFYKVESSNFSFIFHIPVG